MEPAAGVRAGALRRAGAASWARGAASAELLLMPAWVCPVTVSPLPSWAASPLYPAGSAQRQGRPQLLAVRLHAHRRQRGGQHIPLHPGGRGGRGWGAGAVGGGVCGGSAAERGLKSAGSSGQAAGLAANGTYRSPASRCAGLRSSFPGSAARVLQVAPLRPCLAPRGHLMNMHAVHTTPVSRTASRRRSRRPCSAPPSLRPSLQQTNCRHWNLTPQIFTITPP